MADERQTENARRGHRVYRERFRLDRRRMLQFRHPTVATVRRFVSISRTGRGPRLHALFPTFQCR